MWKGLLGLTFLIVLVGMILQELDLGVQFLQVPDGAWTAATGSWTDWIPFIWVFNHLPMLDELLDVDVWLVNCMGTFVALMTFQIDEIPPKINMLIFVPLGMMMLWFTVSLVRGSNS